MAKLLRDEYEHLLPADEYRIWFEDGEELASRFLDKLIEEAVECNNVRSLDELVEELGDLIEVIDGLSALLGITDAVRKAQRAKADSKGRYMKGLVGVLRYRT